MKFTFITVDISDISDVRKGWKTDTFNKIGAVQDKKSKAPDSLKMTVDERSCFSIVYNDGIRKDKTLDLVAPNPEIADKWVSFDSCIFKLLKTAVQ